MTEQPKVARYKILGKLGSGGMGVVYRAEDTTLQRFVALKLLPADLSARDDLRIRFLREARTVAALNHPNICTIHEVGEVEPGASLSLAPGDPPLPPGTPYLAMELVEGQTLQQVLSSHEPLPLKSLIDIAVQVAEGLAEAHQRHIVHRDLKPGNIMVTPQGRVKILDFGLAKALQPAHLRDDLLTASQTISEERTREGKVVGTIAYMSPEQARGQALDARSDTFSFGIVLYEMASGKSPFAGSTPMDTLSAIIQKQERPVRELNPEVPPKLADVVGKCLAKDPAERYQDSRDIVVDLKYLARELSSGVSSPSALAVLPIPFWRRPAVWAAAAALVILPVAGTALLMRGGGPRVADPASSSLAVLAFENLKDPSDPERLGQILQELIITDLSEHDSVKVFSSQRLYDVCKQITGKEPKTLDRAIATQVASRAGAATMLTGTLSQLGPQWILTGQLVDVAKGTVLKSARIDGTDLYAMVDQLTTQIRRDFHVPASAPVAADIPVIEKTASSMQAYQHFLAGQDLLNTAKYRPAAEEFQKAIAIDPAFSQAYYKLAIARLWSGDDLELAEEPLSELLSGRLRVSGKEKLMAGGTLSLVGHCYEQGQSVFERLVHDYPEEKEAWYALGEALYHGGGDLSRAREAFDTTMKLDPAFTLSWQHILDIALRGRKQSEFFARIKGAIQKDPRNLLLYRYWLKGAIRSHDERETEAAMVEATARHVSQEERRELYKAAAQAYLSGERADVEGAEEFYRKAQEADPRHEDSDIGTGLGVVYFRRGDYPAAEKQFSEILEKDPKNTNALGAVLDLCGMDRRYKEAISRVERAIQADPENPALYRLWVRTTIVANDPTGTERAMREALRRHTEGATLRVLYTNAAWAQLEQWDPEKVEEYSRKALDAVPGCENAEIVQLMGMSEAGLHRYAEAERWLQKALALAADNPGIYYSVYNFYHDQRRYGDFLRTAEGWIRNQPGSTVPYLQSAKATVFMGQEDKIDAAIAAALAHRADPIEKKELFREMGWCYFELSDRKRGEAFWRKALEGVHSPADAWACSGLGWALLRRGNDREAERWLLKALRDKPFDENVLRGLSEVHLARKEYSKALEYAREMASSSPTSPWGRVGIHEVLVRSGRLSEAEHALESDLATLPSLTARRRLLIEAGWTYVRVGRLESARSAVDRAHVLDPEGRNPDVHEILGWLLLLQGKREEAERAFRAGVVAMPRHDRCLRGLATIALLGKQDADAEKVTRDVLAQGPANVSTYRLLASILADEGKFAEAEKSARKAVSMDASRESLDLLAWILVAGNLDVDGGIASTREALKVPQDYWESWERLPFTPVAEHTLGLAALKKGASRDAVKYLEAAARLRPDRSSILEDLRKARAGIH